MKHFLKLEFRNFGERRNNCEKQQPDVFNDVFLMISQNSKENSCAGVSF